MWRKMQHDEKHDMMTTCIKNDFLMKRIYTLRNNKINIFRKYK